MRRKEREGIRDSMCYEDPTLVPPPPPPPPPPPKQTASSSVYPVKAEIDLAEAPRPRPNEATNRDSRGSEKRSSWWKEYFQNKRRNDSVTGADDNAATNGKRASWGGPFFRQKSQNLTKRLSCKSGNQTALVGETTLTPTAQHQDSALLGDRQPLEAEASRPLGSSLGHSRPLDSSPPPLPIRHSRRNQQPKETDGEPSSSSQPTRHAEWTNLPQVDSD